MKVKVKKMIPGPIEILECPYCKTYYKSNSLLSGNTCGALYWTDGKWKAPMLPQYPDVTKCTTCYNFFWIDDAFKVGSIDVFTRESRPLEFENAREIKSLSIKEYKRGP